MRVRRGSLWRGGLPPRQQSGQWWAPHGIAAIPTSALDPPLATASPAVPALTLWVRAPCRQCPSGPIGLRTTPNPLHARPRSAGAACQRYRSRIGEERPCRLNWHEHDGFVEWRKGRKPCRRQNRATASAMAWAIMPRTAANVGTGSWSHTIVHKGYECFPRFDRFLL